MRRHGRRLAAGLLAGLLLGGAGALPAAAKTTAYETYTYSYEGNAQISPNAYTPQAEWTVFGEAGALEQPADLAVDSKTGRLLIADKGNNRVLVLDEGFGLVKVLDRFTNSQGADDAFKGPQGVFVAGDGRVYVADTENARIVVFGPDYTFLRTIDAPSADILPDNFKYAPKAVAVDGAGRLYVVSLNTNMGVIALDANGGFEGFLGAQRVTPNPAEMFRRLFMSQEQLDRSVSFVPMEYNNLTIDAKGFVYVTSSSIDRYQLYSAVWSRSGASTYSPIKKINPGGIDVLRRNGFFPPVGDIGFDAYAVADGVDPSRICDVELLDNGMYMLADAKDGKVFTYDSYGNLLYAFGGAGEALGLYNELAAVAARGDALYVLDAASGSITALTKTDYAKRIDEVIGYQENREFDKALGKWNDILDLNNNFDMAYLGIGKTMLEQGHYQQAMDYFRLINNKAYYSRAYKLARQQTLEQWGVWLFLGVLVLIVLVVLFFRFTKRYNARTRERPRRGRLRDELLFAFYVLFHPFNGFWELKRERRGSGRAAAILLAAAGAAVVLRDFAVSYLQQPSTGARVTLFESLVNLLLPLALWCIANWCLTSLMDGKGTFGDIVVASSYALLPLVLFVVPTTLVSHFLVLEELPLLGFAANIGTVWMGALLVFGSMTIHDYSFGKCLLVTLLTVLGMAVLLFLLMLFFSLSGRIVSLVQNIYNEVTFRL